MVSLSTKLPRSCPGAFPPIVAGTAHDRAQGSGGSRVVSLARARPATLNSLKDRGCFPQLKPLDPHADNLAHLTARCVSALHGNTMEPELFDDHQRALNEYARGKMRGRLPDDR